MKIKIKNIGFQFEIIETLRRILWITGFIFYFVDGLHKFLNQYQNICLIFTLMYDAVDDIFFVIINIIPAATTCFSTQYLSKFGSMNRLEMYQNGEFIKIEYI